eukprot:5038789-Pleurochrysis_carterae.AAC.1
MENPMPRARMRNIRKVSGEQIKEKRERKRKEGARRDSKQTDGKEKKKQAVVKNERKPIRRERMNSIRIYVQV